MTYIVRTEGGLAVGVVDNRVAGKMMRELLGHWEEKRFVDGSKATVYIFDQRSVYSNGEMGVCIFHGHYLERKV